MRRSLVSLWNVSQPLLRIPRLGVAYVLRVMLFRTIFIAITGSNGKTTATRFLAAILSSQAPTQWTRLNRNSLGGFTETIAFCNPLKTRFAIFEVGAGKPDAVNKASRLIRPDIAVVLSVFLEHRSYFKSLEAVAREKANLLSRLPSDGVAVLNADDPLVASMPVLSGRKQLSFGASSNCDIYYKDAISSWPQMFKFTVVVNGQQQEIRTRLLGTHWIGPVLACIAVARYLGVPLEKISRAIEQVPPYPGRMQVVRLPSGAIVIRDEFKGTQHTINAAFEELRKACANRKFLVFCDEAESSLSPRKRLAKIGRRAAKLVDYAIFIGEKSQHGIQAAVAAGLSEDRAIAFPSYSEAAQFLKPLLGQGDIVLLKADQNNQLPRLFYSMLGDVRCSIPVCKKRMVCDDCPEFKNPELVKLANERLTVRVD